MVVAAAPALAQLIQNYPNRPVKIVVPFATGGAVDILSHAVGQKLSEQWGQQVMIDNRAGAGGYNGAELAARAATDGYTILMGDKAHANAMTLYHKLSYDFVRGFAPVTLAAITPMVVVTHPSLPMETTRNLIQLAATAAPHILSRSC